MQLRFNSL